MTEQISADENWRVLFDELDHWHRSGKQASFWWRDDDAIEHSEQLERLDQMSRDHQLPLSIAVIPSRFQPSLIDFVSKQNHITVLQHGYAHQSHAAEGFKKIEIGGERRIEDICAELDLGYKSLQQGFGEQFIPVLVPPWNRIDVSDYTALQAVGFIGISSMWARKTRHPADGLLQVNTHLDPVNWRHDRGFINLETSIIQLHRHLHGRRSGLIDADEATGILTHHLDQTNDVWEFSDELFRRLSEHPAVNWLDARAIWC